MGMIREEGTAIGRFKASRLMEELGLICKQPGSHAYKRATVERIEIPNHLNRKFAVNSQDQVWCGDITYVWAQGHWHYLAGGARLVHATGRRQGITIRGPVCA
ncbi:transposase [Pandoraea cepalis]|uniref:Transposase n=1 Tax=Pandoraea cepalis TaxID=2508294 RepID=A0A5E4VM14_9BURK|nr:transposase [Pandoraea cepalis]